VTLFDCRKPADRDRGVIAAIAAVKRGDLVVLPTDTLYGLGCDAFKKLSVSSLLRTKGRGRNMPSAVLVGSRRTLDGLAYRLPKSARTLAEAFWPGALTMIIAHSPTLEWDLGETNGTVAVRMPLHPVALEVLRETGPMAVSSANKTGQPPALTAAEAQEQLGFPVKVYLEAGPCPETVPSTIVDMTRSVPRVVRSGAISVAQLQAVLPELEGPPEPPPAPSSEPPPAPSSEPSPESASEPPPSEPPPASSAEPDARVAGAAAPEA
jgi:tRNA threonylcarbamoyl adenosine modification protein (Sua5/YciO/YrdC/YwlC family)